MFSTTDCTKMLKEMKEGFYFNRETQISLLLNAGIALTSYSELSLLQFSLLMIGTSSTLTSGLLFRPTKISFYNLFSPIAPYTLSENGLYFENQERMKPSDLKTACQAVIWNSVKSAKFSLCYLAFFSARISCNLNHPEQEIADLVKNPECKLISLALPRSNLYFDTFKIIYDAIPNQTTLKKIDLSDNELEPFTIQKIKDYMNEHPKGITLSGVSDGLQIGVGRGLTEH